jgi:zinc protease
MIHEILSNGIEVLVKPDSFSKAVAVQCWVEAGAIHETPQQRGMAHYIEHMLFKGTKRRAVGEIASTVEACGGNINAYTSFDHTVFYLTLASEHALTGVDLLADAIFNSAFDEEEFEREKEVILEEIRRGEDSPGQLVGRKVFEMAFSGSEAGRPIIGYSDQVASFTRDQLVEFYKSWYQPKNLRLIIVGDVEPGPLMDKIRSDFGQTTGKPLPDAPVINRTWPTEMPVCLIKGDYKQPRIEVVYPAPATEDVDTVALDLASFALGSGELGRFNLRLRDKEQVVTTVGCSLYSPSFGGIFEFSAYTTEDKILSALTGFASEAQKIVTNEPITDEEIERARANLRAERIYRDETVEGQARALGSGMRTSQGLLSDDVFEAQINNIQNVTVKNSLNKWIKLEQPLFVVLLPEDSKITEEQVKSSYLSGLKSNADLPSQILVSEESKNQVSEHIYELSEGIKFIYRHNPRGELFSLTAASEGGLRGEDYKSAGLYNAFSGLLTCSTESVDYQSLMSKVEGMGAALEGFSGKDSFGFNLTCLTEQVDELLELFADCILNPVFPEEQWQTISAQVAQSIVAQNDSPSGICVRKFQEEIYGDHPYRFPIYGTEDSNKSFNAPNLLEAYKKASVGGPWVFAACGSIDPEHIHRRLKGALSDFKVTSKPREFLANDQLPVAKPSSCHLLKDREQAHIIYGFGGLTWNNDTRIAMDVLTNVLGGHGGRLFLNLRDRDSLAYTVSPIVTYGKHPGVVGSYIACAPTKCDEAKEGLRREMLALAEKAPSDEEVSRAIANLVGGHQMGLQRSYAQASTMALMELYGIGYDDFLTYPNKLLKTTAEDVQKVASNYFDDSNAVVVTVGPEV